MNDDLSKRLETLETKIDAIYLSVEKTRKYFLWTLIITLVLVALPAIALVFALPSFVHNYTSTLDSLSNY